jgi:hypothetical protein
MICLILCLQQTGEIDNLTASWGKVLWLCCVQVPRCCWCQSYAQIGAINKLSRVVANPASINLQKWFLSPTGLIKPWLHTEWNFPLCSSYLPLGVLNWVATTSNQAFFWCRCGEEKDFCKGSLSLPICYFVIVLLTLFTLFLLASFYQKYKKIVPFIVGTLLLLLLVHYVVPKVHSGRPINRWYVSNVSIIFDAPCLFLHHLSTVSLHFVALLCIFRN